MSHHSSSSENRPLTADTVWAIATSRRNRHPGLFIRLARLQGPKPLKTHIRSKYEPHVGKKQLARRA